MAIIYTYPTKTTLATSDLILISDSADSNKTKNATVTSIKDAIDVVDSITATSPLVASGSTGAITLSIPAATSGVNGYLTSTNWSTFNGKQEELQSGVNIKTINSNSILGSGDLVISGAAANPAGNAGEIQYNNDGTSFGADTFFTTNRTDTVSVANIIEVKGTGTSGNANVGRLKLYCDNNSHYVEIKSPVHAASGIASYSLALPASLPNVTNQILESNQTGTLSWIPTPTGSATPAAGETGQVQYNDGSDGFVASANITIGGVPNIFSVKNIIRARALNNNQGKIELFSNDDAESVSIQGPPNGGSSYEIRMPNAVGTPNQVLKLPSTIPGSGASQLVWGDATGASYVAGDGLNLTGTTFSTDLKANSGLVIDAAELALDLSASSITGTLAVADGGTGTTAIGQYSVFVGTSNTAVERSSSATGAIQLPSGTTAQAPTGVNGMLRYDTTTNKLMVYENGYWKNITTALP